MKLVIRLCILNKPPTNSNLELRLYIGDFASCVVVS